MLAAAGERNAIEQNRMAAVLLYKKSFFSLLVEVKTRREHWLCCLVELPRRHRASPV